MSQHDGRPSRAEDARPTGGRSALANGDGDPRPSEEARQAGSASGDRAAGDDTVERSRELEEQVARLEDEVADLRDRWQRALAEHDNLRKRLARQIDEERGGERARVTSLWLPVVDDLERAVAHADADPAVIVEGVLNVLDEALGVLERLGFPRHDPKGERFDPARHEAVATATDHDADPGTVLEVVRPGYGHGDRQLRPASVVVSTKGG